MTATVLYLLAGVGVIGTFLISHGFLGRIGGFVLPEAAGVVFLVMGLANLFFFARPENGWAERYHPLIRSWAAPRAAQLRPRVSSDHHPRPGPRRHRGALRLGGQHGDPPQRAGSRREL